MILPTIQISHKLHEHITQHRIKLIKDNIEHNRAPDVSYSQALEDMIKKLQAGHVETIEKHKNKKTAS